MTGRGGEMGGAVEYWHRYTREQIRANPDTVFVFGDNLMRLGYGGQAREARGEPNAVGIPTKREPAMAKAAFLADADLPRFKTAAWPDLERLHEHLLAGGRVVMPADGIGTGLAQMAERAPACWRWLNGRLAAMGIENPKAPPRDGARETGS